MFSHQQQLINFQRRMLQITWLLLIISALVVTAAKFYFRGTMCRVNRDIRGKTVVITGASSGIGKQVMRALASKQCTIIFGAPFQQQAEKAVKQVKQDVPKAKIIYHTLNLGNLASIRQFSEQVKTICSSIDILINNAGVSSHGRRQTESGLQFTIGVNFFGHFYLTYLLWPLIKRSDSPRVINVSSVGHHLVKKESFPLQDIDLKEGYNQLKSYTRSKLANILFTKELQRRMDRLGIQGLVMAVHPGVVRTQLFDKLKWFYKLIIKWILWPVWWICIKGPYEGAQTTLHTVLEESSQLVGGGYYAQCREQQSSDLSKNQEYASRLWQIAEERLKISWL